MSEKGTSRVNRILTERYSMGRLRWIAAIAGLGALIAFALGNSEVALGAVFASPVGMLNYYLMARAVQSHADEPKVLQTRILRYSLVRMFVSALTLFIAFGFGVDVMLGALIGVTAEMFTYMGDTLRLVRSARGGE